MPQENNPQSKEELEKTDGADSPFQNAVLSLDDTKRLLLQVESERKYCWDFHQPRLEEMLLRLKLYNNQRRNKDAVGDTTLFTVHNTVLASLYEDRLAAGWDGRRDGDEETAENLNVLAENDYREMEKDQMDYEWDWDAGFFGSGLVEFAFFDRESKTPIFQNVDRTTFLRDPRAKAINPNRAGKNGARFFGEYVRMTKDEMETNGSFFNLAKIKITTNKDSTMERAREARAEAQGYNNNANVHKEADLGDNAEFESLKWYTHFKPTGGKRQKIRVYLANGEKLLIKYEVIKTKRWPLAQRKLYPVSNDFDGVSIPDLVEDKQRKRAVVLNLAIKNLESRQYPSYIYDKNKIKNRADLTNMEQNKYIPIDGEATSGVIAPIQKDASAQDMVNFILNTLDSSAQRATSTPELQQGVMSKEQRTLGELNLISKNVDTRYSLAVKIFSWSEAAFWMLWYELYKIYFKAEIDEKILRLTGPNGKKFKPFTREAIITKSLEDPDVTIKSAYLIAAERMKQIQNYNAYLAIVLQDPGANRLYAIRKMGELYSVPRDEVETLLPLTLDELEALAENDLLNKDEDVFVKPNQNHAIHLWYLARAAETPATYAHRAAHIHAMMLQRERPDLFPELQDQAAAGAVPGQTPPMTPGAGRQLPGQDNVATTLLSQVNSPQATGGMTPGAGRVAQA